MNHLDAIGQHEAALKGAGRDAATNLEFERRLFTLRKVISNRIYDEYWDASMRLNPLQATFQGDKVVRI